MSNQFLDAFQFISDQHHLVVTKLVDHIVLSAEAVAIAIVIGLPIGILLGHLHRFSFLAINISNIGRALPSLAILAIFLPLVGVGNSDVIIALVILAAPPILTNAYVAIDQVDADTVDAAKGIGLRPWQVITRVELPQGLPLIFAGIRTSTVFAIATATLGGIFGGGGLGDIISNEASFGPRGVIGASYVLIALAFASQALFFLLERGLTPRGMRQASAGRGLFQRRAGMAETLQLQAGTQQETEDLLERERETSSAGDAVTTP